MIIDAILERRSGGEYGPKQMRYLYDEAMLFGIADLASAIDGGDSNAIAKALCHYVDVQGYGQDGLLEYIIGENWVAEDEGKGTNGKRKAIKMAA